MDDQVTALLRRAADVGGDFIPPDIAGLATRGRRRRLTRTALAVASVVILVAGLAVGLHFAGSGSSRHVAQPTSTAPPPGPAMPPGPSLAALEHGRWTSLPRAPILPRISGATAWTGSQLLIWGGVHYGHDSRVLGDGAAYTPASRSWRTLPKAPLSPRSGATYAWTGSVLFVWGGSPAHGSQQLTDGAMYDPKANRWQSLPPAPVREYQYAAAVSTNGKVVLVTSSRGDTGSIHATEYDPSTNRWTSLPDLALPAGHELLSPAALAAGERIFVWSLWSHTTPTGDGFSVGSGTDSYALDLSTRGWSPVPIHADRGSDLGTPLWTGSRVLLVGEGIYCGSCSHPPSEIFRGVSINPVSGARTEMTQRGFGVHYPDYVWTGSFVIGFNESYRGPNLHRGSTAAWDPRRNAWTDLPQAPAHTGNQVTVWTGRSLLAWTADGALLEFTPRD